MKHRLLKYLRCPFCWGDLKDCYSQTAGEEITSGILECYCSQYPIVAGIPILQKEPSVLISQIVACIRSGSETDALLLAVSPLSVAPPSSPELAPPWIKAMPSIKGVNRLKHVAHLKRLHEWRTQAKNLLSKNRELTATSLLAFFYQSNKDAFDYFAFRFGQPRHLVALSLASIVQDPAKPILDLACGHGHIARNLIRRAKDQAVVGVDPNFLGLYIAKMFIAPGADYICCVMDAPLPFPDGFFSVAFCSDAFHYFVRKRATILELKRLTGPDGLIILTWVHNKLFRLPHDGIPLPPEGYEALVSDMPNCLIADSEVLRRYRNKQGPSLVRPGDLGRLRREPLLSVVASHRQEVFRDYDYFDEWPHAEGNLQLNPLYKAKNGRSSTKPVQFQRTFPSHFYETDHAECREYLPEAVTMPPEVIADLTHARRTSKLQTLIDECVVLDIPDRYR